MIRIIKDRYYTQEEQAAMDEKTKADYLRGIKCGVISASVTF